jgi:hypothetical protein
MAALPTEFIANAKNNRYHTPTNNIAKTGALKIFRQFPVVT